MSIPRRLSISTTLIFVSVLLGCSAATDEPVTGHRMTIVEEEGVTVIRNTGGPKFDRDLFEYQLVTEVRPDPEVPESMLYRPSGRDIDDDGFLYVADSGNHRIAVFDAQGTFVRSIGREGEGPGEFQYPTSVEIVEDLVHVPDHRRRGTHIFLKDGTFVDFVPLPRLERAGSYVPERWLLTDGRQVVRLIAQRRESDVHERVEIVAFDEAEEEIARVTSAWVWTGEMHTIVLNGRSGAVFVPAHYHARVWGGWTPLNGIYVSTGEAPVIRWYSLDGEPTARWEIDLPIRPVTDADRDAAETQARENLERSQEPPEPGTERAPSPMARVRATNVIFAEHKPYWGMVRADDRGYLWLSRPIRGFANPGSDEDVPIYRLLSPEGEYLGSTTPPGIRGTPSRGYFLTRRLDEASGETVPLVYRMVPAVEGFSYRSAGAR